MLRARREHGQGIGGEVKATDLTKSLVCDRHRILLGDKHHAHEQQNTHFSPKGMGYCILLHVSRMQIASYSRRKRCVLGTGVSGAVLKAAVGARAWRQERLRRDVCLFLMLRLV